MGNDDGSGCADLCAALDGGGRGGAGVAVEVCAADEPDIAGEEGGDVFSIGTAAVPDDRFAIVFANSVGACKGVWEQVIRTNSNQMPGSEEKRRAAAITS